MECSGIINNGLIKLGINPTANLIVGGGASVDGETDVGLRYIFPGGADANGNTESESISFGSPAEGWGVSANGSESIYFNKWKGSSSNYVLDTFSCTTSTAISTVSFSSGKLQVTHDFHPSPDSSNLYEVTVTLTNTSGGSITNLRYRRTIDWDIYPAQFNECVLINQGPSPGTYLVATTSDGFYTSNPLVPIPCEGAGTCGPLDNGPDDQGAGFDFQFPSLPNGESFTFSIYFGAGGNQAEAEAAIAAVNAEVYTFAKPTSSGSCTGKSHIKLGTNTQ